MIEVYCIGKELQSATCGHEDDTFIISGIKLYDTVADTTRMLYAPVYAEFGSTSVRLFDSFGNSYVLIYAESDHSREQLEALIEQCGCCGATDYLKVNNTPLGYIPTTSGNTANLNEVVEDSAGDTWIIDALGNARNFAAGGTGTVTSFSAGDLSPLFTTNVTTPTTTPALSFTLTNSVNARQVFGRIAVGTGAPSWVTLGLVAFSNDYNDLINKPTIPTVNDGLLTLSATGALTGSATFSANQATPATFTVAVASGYVIPTTGQVSNWNTAYSWGNHTGKYVAVNTTNASYNANLGAYNANSLLQSAFIYVANGTNLPAHPYGQLISVGSSAAYGFQLYKPIYTNYLYIRNRDNSVWSAWDAIGLWNVSGGSFEFYSPTQTVTTLLSTDPGNAIGDVTIGGGGASWAGIVQIRRPNKTQVGLIGYFTDRMYYEATGAGQWHEFRGKEILFNDPSAQTRNKVVIKLAAGEESALGGGGYAVTDSGGGTLGYIRGYYSGAYRWDIGGTGDVVLRTGINSTPADVLTAQANGYVRIHNIPNSPASTQVLVSNGGVVSYRDASTLGGGGNAVWRVQGSATDATTNTQAIYHNGNVYLGDASGTSSSYRLAVIGSTYLSSTIDINNQTWIRWSNVTPGTWLNGIRYNSSNQLELGQTSYNVLLVNYPNSRDDLATHFPTNFLYTAASGLLHSGKANVVLNTNISLLGTTPQTQAADSTWRKLTGTITNTTAGQDYGQSAGDIIIPATAHIHRVHVTAEYTMSAGGSGTPDIEFEFRLAGVKIPNSDWQLKTTGERGLVHFHFDFFNTASAKALTLHCRVVTGTGSIVIQKFLMSVDDKGLSPP